MNDPINAGEAIPEVLEETTSTIESTDIMTAKADPNSDKITEEFASFGHRPEAKESQDPIGCANRLRITASMPFQRGAVWRSERVFVQDGFKTQFRFQVTDHSRKCTNVRDVAYGTGLYKSCVTHGADGFAFVLHTDINGSSTIGQGGDGLGYAGIRTALALEFDMFYNPSHGDVLQDHLSLQSSGPARLRQPVGQGELHRIAVPAIASLGDGLEHTVKIAYYPRVRMDLLPKFSAQPALLPLLRDGGESRRVGTLAVWFDDMDEQEPVIALPLAIHQALDLSQGQAWAGFTGSTGLSFQKHDVTYWHFCEEPECTRLEALRLGLGGPGDYGVNGTLDYHQNSNV